MKNKYSLGIGILAFTGFVALSSCFGGKLEKYTLYGKNDYTFDLIKKENNDTYWMVNNKFTKKAEIKGKDVKLYFNDSDYYSATLTENGLNAIINDKNVFYGFEASDSDLSNLKDDYVISNGVCYGFYPGVAEKDIELNFDSSVTKIADFSFFGSESEKLTIGGSISEIGEKAFCSSSLQNVYLESNVSTIGNSAFESSKLINFTADNSISALGERAFKDCEYLKKFAANFTQSCEIKTYAFSDCTALSSIYLPIGMKYVAKNAFINSNTMVFCGDAKENTSWNIDWSKGVSKIYWNAKSLGYLNGYTFYIKNDNTASIVKYDDQEVREIIIPAGFNGYQLTEIESYAFKKTPSLTSVVIPNGVTHINKYIFSDCINLAKIYVPSTVTSIDSYLTDSADCMIYTGVDSKPSTWKDLHLGGDTSSNTVWNTKDVSHIDEDYEYVVLSNNTVQIMKYNGRGVNLDIPQAINGYPVSSIYRQAFKGCTTLVDVTIPDSVTIIHPYAFYGCTNMKRLFIPNSVVTIKSNILDVSTTVVYTSYSSKPSTWSSLRSSGDNSKNLVFNSTSL